MLSERDDLRHRISGPHARESLFYNLLLPDEGLSVFFYTWVDAFDRAGGIFAVFGDDGRPGGPGVPPDPIVFEATDGVFIGDRDFDHWELAGMSHRHRVPLRTTDLTFVGEDVAFELTFEACHDAFAYSDNKEGCPPPLAHDRFEQSGRVRGTLRIPGRDLAFDTTAHRDHSWGTRDWNSFHHWKWISGQAGGDCTFNALQLLAGGREWINGYVNRNGDVTEIVGIRHDTTYDDDFTQRRGAFELTDAAGRTMRVEAERFSFMRLAPNERMVMHEAGCAGTVDGAPGLVHFEMGWPKDYVAHQSEVRAAGSSTA